MGTGWKVILVSFFFVTAGMGSKASATSFELMLEKSAEQSGIEFGNARKRRSERNVIEDFSDQSSPFRTEGLGASSADRRVVRISNRVHHVPLSDLQDLLLILENRCNSPWEHFRLADRPALRCLTSVDALHEYFEVVLIQRDLQERDPSEEEQAWGME